jgi:predicted transcriptional regulator of viral defense system
MARLARRELPRPTGAMGLTPETLSRAVGRLVRAGVLRKLQRGRFQVLDPEALRRAAAAPPLAAE